MVWGRTKELQGENEKLVREAEEFRARWTEARERVEALEEENRTLREDAECHRTLFNNVSKKADGLEADNSELLRRISDLRDKLEKTRADLRQKGDKLLPAKIEEIDGLKTRLAVLDRSHAALTDEVDDVRKHNKKLNSNLRLAESGKANAERGVKAAIAAAAHYEVQYLVHCNPLNGSEGDSDAAIRLRRRILAWLGCPISRTMLKLPEDVCPLCNGNPACQVGDPPHIHGTNLTFEHRKYLQAIVKHADERGLDVRMALRGWAENLRHEEPEE